MAHGLVHGCTALPGLSPAAIVYIITGSVDKATEQLVFEDLCDPELRLIVNTVKSRTKNLSMSCMFCLFRS